MKKLSALIILLSFNFILFGQTFKSESDFKIYFEKNASNLDRIEGIWVTDIYKESYEGGKLTSSFLAQKNIGKKAYVKSATNTFLDYELNGELTGVKVKKSSTGEYTQIGKNNSYSKLVFIDDVTCKIFINNTSTTNVGDYLVLVLTKEFPTETIDEDSPSKKATGFAISSDGYIVTNYHVVENAKTISIRGVNGDFTKSLTAKVIVTDKNNDLAILKIDDNSFTTLGVIPYAIKSNTSDVGESVYVLGYPLTSTMGEEIKLTDGLISSKTGYEGDASSYQVTTPIQPGNSGAPLFDKSGNLIGVINSKYEGAENVGYAVKSSYLINLIDLLPTTPKLQTQNLLLGKNLPEQVKLVKKFIYIIEIN